MPSPCHLPHNKHVGVPISGEGTGIHLGDAQDFALPVPVKLWAPSRRHEEEEEEEEEENPHHCSVVRGRSPPGFFVQHKGVATLPSSPGLIIDHKKPFFIIILSTGSIL